MRKFSFKPSVTIKGRKFKGPLKGFSGKPLHPPLTDIVVGAYVIAPILDLISYFGSSHTWADSMYRSATAVFVAGAAFSLLTALSGWMDWFDTEKGTQVRRTANAHAWTMIFMTFTVLANIGIRLMDYDAHSTSTGLLALSVLILILVTVGGTIGGSLTYDYGFNVETSTDHPVWHKSETDVMPGESKKSS